MSKSVICMCLTSSLAGLVIFGCAGSGAPTAAPLAGTYNGSANIVAPDGLVIRPGVINLTFTSSSSTITVSGSDNVCTPGIKSADVGSITSAGALTLTATSTSGTATISGQLSAVLDSLKGTGTITLSTGVVENVVFFLGKLNTTSTSTGTTAGTTSSTATSATSTTGTTATGSMATGTTTTGTTSTTSGATTSTTGKTA